MRKLFLTLTVLLFLACSKNDDNQDYKTTLPEATQTGVVMFACYVDGKAYISKGYGQVTCFYQWVDGRQHFIVSGDFDNNYLALISVGGGVIEQGMKYSLKSSESGYAGSATFVLDEVFARGSETNMKYTGELTITTLNMEKEIVSGTFWYDIENPYTGEKVEIREGRFDTHFSQ